MQTLYLLLEPVFMSFSVIILCRQKVKVQDVVILLLMTITLNALYGIINIIASLILYVFMIMYSYYKNKEIWISIVSATVIYSFVILFEYISAFFFSMFNVVENYSLLYIVIALAAIYIPLYTFLYFVGRKIINYISKTNSQMFAALVSIFVAGAFFANIYLDRVIVEESTTLIILNIVVFIMFFAIFGIIMIIYLKAQKIKMETKHERLDYDNLKTYTNEIESQYSEVRKFRHDYQNIVLSLDGFFADNDYEGLKGYYNNHMKKSFEDTIYNDYRLDDLSKIKVKELKSIFSTKLIKAQELGIDVSFEARDVLESINVDPIYLIRMLGIVLDNAIEELVDIEDGTLNSAVIVEKDSVVIVMENTCKENTERLHIIKRDGYTTKKNHSGLGLTIMDDIVAKNKNLLLETTIENNKFIQKIIILND